MGTKAAVIALALVSAIFCGCGAVPQSKYYELKLPGETSSSAAGDPLPITLLVGPLKASHLYREDRLVYATDSELMGTYQLQRWAAPPTEMMRELLWRTLRASHRYSGVHLLTSNSRGDFVLEGNLYDFKEVSGSNIVARVNLELELRDTKTGAIVWSHDYVRDEPVNGKDVPAVVAALDQNAQRCVSESEISLMEYFSTHLKR
jgi:cholesterol transport system auxiliary component